MFMSYHIQARKKLTESLGYMGTDFSDAGHIKLIGLQPAYYICLQGIWCSRIWMAGQTDIIQPNIKFESNLKEISRCAFKV